MNKRQIQNGELDAAGVKLLKAGRLRGDEIDRIVARPNLFDGVMAKVAMDDRKPAAPRGLALWKAAAGSMAAVAVFAATFGYFGYFQAASPVVRTLKVPAAHTSEPDTAHQELNVPARIANDAETTRPIVTKAVYREEVKRVEPKRRTAPAKLDEGEFYALNSAGNIEETARDGHIVRVEMPRSSLFALGIDLPLENDTKFVKTDLLVGSDGVPRAIRFVE